MISRVAVAAVLLAIMLAGFIWESLVIVPCVLVAALAVVCYHELAAMFEPQGIRMSRRIGVALLLGLALMGWNLGLSDSYLFIGLAMVLAFVWRMRIEPIEGAWRDISATVAGVAYIGIPIATVIELFVRSEETRAFLLVMLVVAWFTDTGAMIAGKKWGSRKLFPRLSPGKTLEGCLGGLVGAMLVALFSRLLFPNAFWMIGNLHFVLLCLVLGAAAQAGDLAESLLKRAAGVKDSGKILLGHGGALDRVDSILLMTIPFAIYLRLFQPTYFLD